MEETDRPPRTTFTVHPRDAAIEATVKKHSGRGDSAGFITLEFTFGSEAEIAVFFRPDQSEPLARLLSDLGAQLAECASDPDCQEALTKTDIEFHAGVAS